MTLDAKPAMLPTQVFFGLTLGRILLLPNFIPNPKAAVSQIHTDRKSANVIENPMVGVFRNVEREPNIMPSQIKEKIKLLILMSGVCFFRNNSIVIAAIVKPINKSYDGIFHIIEWCLSICNIVININKKGEDSKLG